MRYPKVCLPIRVAMQLLHLKPCATRTLRCFYTFHIIPFELDWTGWNDWCVHVFILICFTFERMLSRKRIFFLFSFPRWEKVFFSKMASGGKMLLWIFGNVWVAVIEWGLDQYISIPKKCFYMQMEFWSKVRLSHQILISLVTLKLWLVSWTYFYWICWVSL